jgi:pyridoxal phosphate enzyme (YggS family)
VPDPRTADLAGEPDAARRAELAGNLAAVRVRIAAACAAAGRPPGDVTLVAVTKTYPAADVLRLAALGVPDIGENRDQEAAPKAAEVADAGTAVRWHFVGRLQRNKARSVAGYADLVHSVDSVRLAEALAAAARERPEPLGVLVQISVDGDASRGGAVAGGAEPDIDIDRVADAVAAADGLRLCGVMAVAPLDWEPGKAFARLAAVAGRLRQRYPDATLVSAGMSDDLEAAIEHGATHVRIGAALLGNRAPLR